MRRVALIASASGNGKTTLGRALAARLDVPFVELDAIVHGPNWTEISDDGLRAALEPILPRPGWVIDGAYEHKIGDLVVSAADTIVWLDLPLRVWLPRLLRRTYRRIAHEEPIFNDNRESWRTALAGRDALVPYALRSHFARRREWPRRYAGLNVVRLRTPDEVDAWLSSV
ncbi:adenylate kinase [Solirubrobacter sp. CPCC 204708]|uniref:Adenylate kinase n=1 Tax=Solirubrobacter deserti TaxID=2282478 RepID=A0ABT4RC10_9ACTN|nr:shikimate kinase [Solirubrobacter deserti]MBE2317186.1 adenylate kinase [Solirubrobacter deserti]MDA0135921.1 hypothetical protein [Solirubrobacter deserti]